MEKNLKFLNFENLKIFKIIDNKINFPIIKIFKDFIIKSSSFERINING